MLVRFCTGLRENREWPGGAARARIGRSVSRSKAMDIEGLRAVVARHAASVNALAALGLALDSRLRGTAMDGETASRTEAVLGSLGVSDLVADASAAELLPVLAGIKVDLLSGSKLLTAPSAGAQTMEAILRQALGDVSTGFPALLERSIAPQLAGLPERLETPGAAFLDIGVGVGALSVSMLREWPGLRAVGIDPSSEAIAQAHANVRAAGLADRIALHTGLAQEVTLDEMFDLAFVPSAFIPEAHVRAIVPRCRAVLKAGGWLLLAMVNPGPDALGEALAGFRTTMWGGTVFEKGAAQALVEQWGYIDTRLLLGPAGAPVAFVAGRKPG
ncbi:class I SAM-dependent methyltransferase [Mesorhizobium sp. M1D.F.Ca.ET.184.01.1.1]|nr:class I SAM-dependent methyltransferase [Mesorhizobium sp. M1D.F.Ca.ET.231.01.1.1]TGP31002.1 class I SAM-dependent methyltransferase [Mesorhizobium sp. M1D.F.Ca.ET.234.01.1.1]TGS45305.1 class I SAM-dependent methyltransferase [Mesorhizobium sp. M1D.F.Ca.ET.184.01.1.1]TGS60780.1 class I SAM-dependent methyltransferase [Mesorhizobium sp. M1D.F.Ca.ET.183.01.1.1]